jgi:hypothetical protein
MGEMKVEIDSVVNNSVRNVKVDMDETLEIERRTCNLVIHGMPETDAKQDLECVVEMMDEVLHGVRSVHHRGIHHRSIQHGRFILRTVYHRSIQHGSTHPRCLYISVFNVSFIRLPM